MGQLSPSKKHGFALLSSFLLYSPSSALGQYSNSSTISFTLPTGYTTSAFNNSAAPTLPTPVTDFSDLALAALWQQIGPISTGPVTTTVQPTPEPSVYPQPGGAYHPLVASSDPKLAGVKLPKGFKWGLASSSYQIEGAANAEGKGPSIWDLLSHRVENWVADNSTGDVLASHYWLYKQDFARLGALGIKAFSPSISWPRIFPFGSGPVNEEGVKHYDDVIVEMHKNGIRPSITLFHWDTPLALFHAYGAWTSPLIVDDFFNYAKFIISRYDAYVDDWFTINEPQYCNWQYASYPAGTYYPAFNGTGPGVKARFLCGHYTLLAHAKVAKWYHEEFKGQGRITFKNSGNYYEANSTSEADKVAAQRNFDFSIGWFGGVWSDGDYPKSLKETLGDLLPTLTQEEKDLIKGSCDFYAIDGYTSFSAFEVSGGLEACVSNRTNPNFPDCAGSVSVAPNGFPVGPSADPGVNWLYDAPTGIRGYLNHLTKVLFPSIPDIVVTEMGFAEPFEGEMAERSGLQSALWDLRRADYFQNYLDNILAAIVYDKVNVTGAWGWAIFDNFEWASGKAVRFGLQYVNYTDLTRTPKASMFQFLNWFKEHEDTGAGANSTMRLM
ncbi:putative beta-glucosidase 34 [Delitschia confertaspora ATCC 74209]|uniref:Beta-glucosidase 34 n=1 Tax=Delitschia confertaspora ATCC 74209 TaxID=1513339 RepID=A0A9P4JSP0_9PLEO|nr:putative beta-glucosidase 34 [Delitschia confertaspora ATCC 74209]